MTAKTTPRKPARTTNPPKQSSPQPPAESPAPVVREGDDLIAATFALFEQGASTFTITNPDGSPGKLVEIYPAKMKHMAQVMRFFSDVAGALQESDLVKIIDLIASKQQQYMAEGKNPRSLNLKEVIAQEGASGAISNANLITLLLEAVFGYLPGVVAIFTNLTEEEFEELDFDHGALVAFGIFTVNYDFFIRRVLPTFLGFIRSLARENAKSIQSQGKAATKPLRP